MTELPVPKMFEHCAALYVALDKHAIVDTADKNRKVFTGSRVEVFRSLHVSQAYYTQLYSVLEEMGCAQLLYTGRAGQPSVMALHHAPELEVFRAAYKRRLTNRGAPSTLEARVDLLEGRLKGIDLGSTLVNFEERLAQIELQLRKADGETET